MLGKKKKGKKKDCFGQLYHPNILKTYCLRSDGYKYLAL